MYGIEAGGLGIERGKHAARFARITRCAAGLQDLRAPGRRGQIEMTHSVSAGLDYAAVGPEHAFYHDTGRIEYTYAIDEEAMEASISCPASKGSSPRLRAPRVAYCLKLAPTLGKDRSSSATSPAAATRT